MRHWMARIFTTFIALMLLASAAAFAWLRSTQLTLTNEARLSDNAEPARTHEFQWEALGAASYGHNCANCHGRRGEGWDKYPPLHGAAAQTLVPGGRDYLVDLHVYGVSAPGRVPMPPMGHIPPAELAAVINHVLRNFGNERVDGVELVTPSEVRARSGQQLSPRDVHRRRVQSAM